MINIVGKHCATCAFWNGERDTWVFQCATVTSRTNKGVCLNPNASMRKRETSSSYYCTKWEKWPVLTKMK